MAVLATQGSQIGLPIWRQDGSRARLYLFDLHRKTAVDKVVVEHLGRGRVLAEILQAEFRLVAAMSYQVLHHSASNLPLLGWDHEDVKIVAELKVTEQFETGRSIYAVATHQGSQPLQRPLAGAYCQHVQLASSTKVTPPRFLPLWGKKHTLKW
jgi:hypothetical protein